MAEQRTRPRRPNHGPAGSGSTTFPTSDISDLLYAYGSSPPHLGSTVACLDEILTDFIIETCHLAALSASYSRRTKLKVEDFKFVLRHDERLLGRSMEHIWRDKRIKEARRTFEDGANAAQGGMGALEGVAAEGGVEGSEMKTKKGRRGKRKRVQEDADDADETESRAGKRVVS